MDQSPEDNRYRQAIDEGTQALKSPGPLDSDDCMQVNRIRIGGYTGRLLSGYNTPAIVEDLRRLFTEKWSEGTIVARAESREVHCCVIGQDEVVYLKRYYVTGIKPFLRTVLRVNKAQKAWRTGRWLCQKGVDTPLPIALFKCYPFSFSSEFVCITKGLTDAVDLYRAVLQVKGKHPNQQKKKRCLIVAVATFVARLHNYNIYHGDFSADNILVRGNREMQDIRVYLIDLDAVRTGYWISERRRVKNLEELGRNFLDLGTISIADRVRFLKVYMLHYTRNKDSLRQLFRKVQQRTALRLVRFGQSFDR
jgi:hypothetical protein